MLGLPKNTELKRPLSKSSIYKKFGLNTNARDTFDADISKIHIVNELSPQTINIAKGKNIDCFYVMLVTLKHKEFSEKNIALISKLIDQNMLFILEYEQKAKLAVYHGKLHQTEWQKTENLTIEFKGLDFDSVWQNIILTIGDIELENDNSLDKQIHIDNQRKSVQNKIETLERKAKAENQPKRKFELLQEIKKLRMTVK